MNDERRTAPRIHVSVPIEVTDSITGEPVGRVGNLSRNGMMLISQRTLNEGALYQLHFRLPGASGASEQIEAGVHSMWLAKAATNGYQWAGLRIISISSDAANRLDHWLERNAA